MESATYREYNFCILEDIGDRLVDPVLMSIIRHHANEHLEQRDIIEFCSESFHAQQLDKLLRRCGKRESLAVKTISVENGFDTYGTQKPVTIASVEMSDMLRWEGGRFLACTGTIPESTANALVGKPLRHLLEHPYLPSDLPIRQVVTHDTHWTATFSATFPRPSHPDNSAL